MASDQWAKLVLDAVNKLANSPSNTWNQAANYAGLPTPVSHDGETWLVLTSTGIWPVNKLSGWYYSDGIAWAYLGAYNPVVTGGNVVVTNFPSAASSGSGLTVEVQLTSTRILEADSSRKGFILTAEAGIIYIGIGFVPSSAGYTYRMTNNSVVEKDGFTGPVYAVTENNSKELYITEIK